LASIKHVQVTKEPFIKREHPAIQNMKFLNFVLLLWVIFALLDPDPDSEYGSRSADNPGSMFGRFLPGSYLGSIFIFLLNFLAKITLHPGPITPLVKMASY
jgi:hypothetical protein